jgi:hypothetical protein
MMGIKAKKIYDESLCLSIPLVYAIWIFTFEALHKCGPWVNSSLVSTRTGLSSMYLTQENTLKIDPQI